MRTAGSGLSAGRALQGRWACAAGALGVRSRGAAGALGVRSRGAGRVGWPWAVHSVHSAYFRSVLTRYFS